MLKELILNKKIQLSIILVLTFLAYSNIFQNGKVWDDYDILSWGAKRDFSDAINFLKGDMPVGHGGVYRPIISFFYVVSDRLYGDNITGYHLQSILLHLISTILIYFIVLKITNKNVIAFMSSLLFGVHPIHTEMITFMTSSFDILGVIFFLLAFYFYISKKYYFSVFFFLLAILGYEPTLILALLIILYDLCTKNFKKEKLGTYGTYFGIIIFYFLIRLFILKINFRFDFLAGSFYYSMLTMTKVVLKYILLIIFPFNLSVDHVISKEIFTNIYSGINKETILAQSIFDFHILFSIFVILALIFIAIKTYKKYPIVSFCIGWFFISLGPVSNIIPRSPLLAERYLYIPSFGFCLLFSYLIYILYKKLQNMRKYLVLFFIFVILIFTGLTFERNFDWKDTLTLWSDTIEKSPYSALGHVNLASFYYSNGQTELAIEHYKKAKEFSSDYAVAYYDLGVIYQNQGKKELAIQEYEKAVEKDPYYFDAYYNLGVIYHDLGEIEKAIGYYKKTVEINPNYIRAINNLGYDYFTTGELDLAIEIFNKALKIEPNSDFPNFNLGRIYQEKREKEKAIYYYKRALEINPNFREARERLNELE